MTVVIVGTLDTKGEEIGFARDVLTAEGVAVHVIDTGVVGEPGIEPDTSASEVAEAAGTTLEHLRDEADRGEAMEAMGEPATLTGLWAWADRATRRLRRPRCAPYRLASPNSWSRRWLPATPNPTSGPATS